MKFSKSKDTVVDVMSESLLGIATAPEKAHEITANSQAISEAVPAKPASKRRNLLR